MAQDGEQPKAVDKGKGKAVDGESNKAVDGKKDKDGKPLVNGKVDGKADEGVIGGTAECNGLALGKANSDTAAEELSEEDQQLKSELDMLVERLTVRYDVYAHKRR
jgi:26S proteasome regulatory subunit N1